MRISVSKVNNYPIFVEDVEEEQWALQRVVLMDRLFFSTSTFDNMFVETLGGAPVTTGTIGATTVTSDKAYGYYKIMLIGEGDTSSCSLSLNRSVVSGSGEIGEWFSVDETSFDYTITVSGTVSLYKVVVIGIRYGDGTMQYLTLS